MVATNLRGSRVLQVRFTSTSPTLSARVANGIARAYIDDKIESSDEAAQQALNWLRERRDQLREQSDRLTRIAEQFRSQNNLIGVDIDRATDAEYERLNQNLITARAELVDLEVRNRRLTEIVLNNDTSAVVRETATQGITAGLRSRYLEVLRAYNNLSSTLGDEHAQTQRRLRELREIEGLMFEEIRRSAQLVRDDIRSARERVASLEAALEEAAERVGADQAIIAELRQLDRNAETALALFASFQRRFEEAAQRQEIPASQARILNTARPPDRPSSPNVPLTLILSAMLGFILSAIIVAFREWRDDRIRSEDQVRNGLGLEFLGELPVIKGSAKVVLPERQDTLATRQQTVLMPELMTYAADNPLSSFAESLRTGKISLSLRHSGVGRGTRMGFVSSLPNEGKTTIAANFANLLAQQGARVILIDGDLRNPGLSRALARPFEHGLVDILLGKKDWREVRLAVEKTGLHVIPNSKTRSAFTAELIGGGGMTALLDSLGEEYEFIVLDLPPLGPVVDARAILDRLDGVFFVMKWGSTQMHTVSQILRGDPRLREKCLGAFLNMFDPKKARAYGGAYGKGYYNKYYTRYYQNG
jgi:succinoglycan biosynthesis transport protein ExoP